MSMSWTYTTLKAAVIATVDGDSSSTGGIASTTNFNNVLQAAEEQIVRDLQLMIWDTEGDITLTANTVTVTKPDGYVAWRYANFTNASSQKVPLDLRTLEYIEDYNPNPATTGTPKYLADYSETHWKVAPTPASTLSGKALYVKLPTSLVTDTDGTWISQNAGLLLFRACLANATKFIKNDKATAQWTNDYKTALAAAQVEFRKLMRPDFSRLQPMPSVK